MRVPVGIFVCVCALAGAAGRCAHAQTAFSVAPSPGASAAADAQPIDGVAARIEDDVITESELRELAAFQTLVDGKAKTRADLIRELADQWIASGEANVAHYAQPSEADVNRAYTQLVSKFSSPEDFKKRCAAGGLSDEDIRRILTKQLYLTGFLDYRFRPAAQIDQKQIEAYYNDELVPKLKAQDQPVPALEDVQDTIEEVLVQQAINSRATDWLNETRARIKIDVMAAGDRL